MYDKGFWAATNLNTTICVHKLEISDSMNSSSMSCGVDGLGISIPARVSIGCFLVPACQEASSSPFLHQFFPGSAHLPPKIAFIAGNRFLC